MSRLHNSLLAAGAGLALTIGGTSGAFADPLIINPSAPNPGGVQIGTVPGTFATTGAQFQFNSDLLVQGSSVPSGGPGGIATSLEVGSFVLFDYQLNGIDINPAITGINHAGQTPLNYTIYGTFSISGTGAWGVLPFGNPNTYTLGAPTVSITLWASPSTGTQATLNGAPSAATDSFGITTGNHDVQLGTFSLGSGVATATATEGGGFGALNFSAFLAPDLNPDYTGLTGYFQNVLSTGLNLIISSTNSTSGLQTVVTTEAAGTGGCTMSGGVACTDFFTGDTVNADGSLNYLVPEPGSLALLGSALLGFGVIRRRRNRKA